MDNSQVLGRVKAVCLGVLADIQAACPQLSLVRDIKRIEDQVLNRGLGFFTLDLPLLDDYLLEGIESGCLVRRPTYNWVSSRVKVPKFLSGLWLQIFDSNGVLREDASPNAILFLRQIFLLGKKVAIECSKRRTKSAVREYIEYEREFIDSPTHPWGGSFYEFLYSVDTRSVDLIDSSRCRYDYVPEHDAKEHGQHNRELLSHLQFVADEIVGRFSDSSTEEFTSFARDLGINLRPKHGPGAVANRQECRSSKSDISRWPARLEQRFSSENIRLPFLQKLEVEDFSPSSKLIAVPKTQKSPRLIASEPVQHQFIQQLILNRLEVEIPFVFENSFLNIRNQDVSREMVQAGSKDLSLATLDLSSASDLLSCWLVERIFRRRKNLLLDLFACRTQQVVIPKKLSGCDEITLPLKKFASQGSACTFPIESIVFTIIAIAAVTYGDSRFSSGFSMKLFKRDYASRVRVFGDDIIVPKFACKRTRDLLHLCGLKVNIRKSFSQRFLESCGMDAFDGFDVTPSKPKVFVATGPQSIVSLLDLSNNLHKAGFWKAADQVLSNVPTRYKRYFPICSMNDNDRPGFLARYSYSMGKYIVTDQTFGWNRELHLPTLKVYSLLSKEQMDDLEGQDQTYQGGIAPGNSYRSLPVRSALSHLDGILPSYDTPLRSARTSKLVLSRRDLYDSFERIGLVA